MEKILIKVLIILSILSFSAINITSNTYAVWTITITVSEDVPWWNCSAIPDTDPIMYECAVQKWFWSVIAMMWEIIKWFTFIAALSWVLFVVINGIVYSMWWLEQSMKDKAKERIVTTLTWLVLLFLSWVILNMIAPWIYK